MVSVNCLAAILLTATALLAKEVEIKEKYALDSGGYKDGKYGQALWLAASGYSLEYPALFAQKQVKEGTVSVWFRPAMADWQWKDLRFVSLSDGKQSIVFNIYNSHADPRKPLKRPDHFLQVLCGKGYPEKIRASKIFHEDFHRTFHHLICTWNEKEAMVFLDGEVLAQQKNEGKWPQPFDGAATKARLSGWAASPILLDEIVILNKHLDPEEAKSFYNRADAWKPDSHTVLYLGFDRTLSAKSVIRDDGENLRIFSYVSRPDATFMADEPLSITFNAANFTPEKKDLVLHGQVKNLKREKVFEKSHKIQVAAGGLSTLDFKMRLKDKGLFWGDYTLEDAKGNVLAKERIPFAVAFVGKYQRDQSPAGFVQATGINPTYAEGWSQIKTQPWRHLEYAPGKWYFESIDMIVEDILRTGRKPQICLYGTPDWYLNRYPTNKYSVEERLYCSPDKVEDFKKFVKILGEHFKGKVYDYEVWNEPYFNQPDPGGSSGYFYGTTERYAELVNAAAEVLHQVDPKTRVCSGLGGPETWQRAVARLTAGKADCYGIHPYNLCALGSDDFSADETGILKMRELLRSEGANETLAVTEIADQTLMSHALDENGYPMTAEEFDKSGRWEKMVEYFHSQPRSNFHDPYTSAALAVRSLIMSVAGGGCEYFLWWSTGCPSAACNLTCLSNTPSLASIAFANAAGILAEYKFVQRVDLGADYLKAYLLREKKGNRLLLVAWADKDPVAAYLELGKGDIKVLDLYGNAHPFERFGPVVKTILTMPPVYVSGFVEMPSAGQPILKTKMSKDFVFPGEPCQVKVTIYNPLEQNLEGKLQLRLPEEFPVQLEQKVNVGSRKAGEYIFEFNVPADTAGNQPIETILTTGIKGMENIELKSELPVRQNATIKRLAAPVKVDGDISEWGETEKFPILIDKPSQVVVGTPYTKPYIPRIDWKGPKDLSLRASLACDDNNLYIAIRVYDDILMNPISRTQPAMSYEGDCVEIFLDGRKADKQGLAGYTEEVYQLSFVPAMKDFPAPIWFVGQPKLGRLPGMVVSSMSLQDGYSLEIKIPFSSLPSIVAKPGTIIGFDIAVDDQDTTEPPPGRKSQMVWAGTKNNCADASLFGRVVFGE